MDQEMSIGQNGNFLFVLAFSSKNSHNIPYGRGFIPPRETNF